MSPEELAAAQRKLAALVGERDRLLDEHADRRKEMRDERQALDEKISSLARTIRQQGR